MKITRKAVGLGVVAILTAATLTMMSASASTGGHFVTDDTSKHTILKGIEKEGNTGVFIDAHNNEAKAFCEEDVEYHGAITAQTVTQLTLTPTFPIDEAGKQKCSVELSIGTFDATIDMNGCAFVFTIGESFNDDNTTHLECPESKDVQITVAAPFGTCTITISEQTPAGGSGYYGIPEGELTVKPTLKEIHAQYIGGAFKCGATEGTTTSEIEFENRIALKAFNTSEEQKSLVATGTKD